jgi:hypothetical protein
MKSASRVAFVLAVVSGLAACTAATVDEFFEDLAASFGDPVVVPARDSSPPIVRLSIPDLGIVLDPGDPDHTVDVSDLQTNGMFIVVEAEDPEGVGSVCFESGFSRVCSAGGITSSSQSLSNTICDSSNAAVGGSATTKRWLPHWVDFAVVSACGPGQTGGTTLAFFATGSNFGGGRVSTPSVVFVNQR